jgi:polyhydroxybutyrate depolymerase
MDPGPAPSSTGMGGVPAPDPSEGCGKANPQTGSANGPLMASSHQYYVKLPQGYDPDTPYKVMIMFNPTGNDINWAEGAAGYEQAAADAIRVYPMMATKANGWQPNETNFFQGLYDALTSNFCIDKKRIFAGGESSGGEFAAFLGCEYGDILRGVAPGAPKNTSWNNGQHQCKGHPVAIVIWSPKDNVLSQPAGQYFTDYYADMNMCGSTSTPVEGWTDALSNCKQFDDCMAGSEVYFCMHNDPEYSNTYHGWAHFAAEMTWEVFSAL